MEIKKTIKKVWSYKGVRIVVYGLAIAGTATGAYCIGKNHAFNEVRNAQSDLFKFAPELKEQYVDTLEQFLETQK